MSIPKHVKYPYSNLNYPIHYYERMVENFFSSMYVGVEFRVISFTEGIGIIIYNVNPNKMYNPTSFDPCYVIKVGEKDVMRITEYDFFETFYSYIPDIVPYLNFKLVAPMDYMSYHHYSQNSQVMSDGSFGDFNFREWYYKEEYGKEFNRKEKQYDNVFQWRDEFVL